MRDLVEEVIDGFIYFSHYLALGMLFFLLLLLLSAAGLLRLS